MNSYNNLPTCNKCGQPYSAWIERAVWAKAFLFWLPLKRYACNSCKSSRHLIRKSAFL
ncbi:hypothetical protein [Mucilaginibacter auburnensis]|uniref:hypothetical protein n=1 Tax=Mucilaginibacter auburnensis TaxID=1457233 RepID=UPI0012FD8984|nr:hypothetical protein [Mucilaginibacter auburnensis]